MRHLFLATALIGTALLASDAAPAQAQIRFGIGIGSGGYGGGGYPMGGFGYGPSLGGFNSQYMVPGYPYYGNGRPSNSSLNYRGYNNGYSNGNNYQRRTVVVQPKRAGDGLPIKIFSLDDAGTKLSYTLNGTPYSIEPGESQMLVNDRQWTITFDRGGDFGSGEYVLSPGQYWFELTSDHGWELYHDADVSKLTKAGGDQGQKNPLPPAPAPSK